MLPYAAGYLSNRTLVMQIVKQIYLPIPRLFCFSVYQTKLQDSGAIAQTDIITRRKKKEKRKNRPHHGWSPMLWMLMSIRSLTGGCSTWLMPPLRTALMLTAGTSES